MKQFPDDHPKKRTQNLNYNLKKIYGDNIKWTKSIDFSDFQKLSEFN